MAAAANSVADATQELYQRYGKQIYAYCLHQLRSREEAEDAVQTTFLNAFRGLQRGTTARFEQAWLYKIAQNVCIARRSSSGKRLRLEAPDDFEVLQEIVPSGGTAPDGDTLELMGLDEALDSMPENQRRAILLREWQGLSYREIAAELDLSQGAVEMLIFRARRTLATALEQPAEIEKRRRNVARTGCNFGTLFAALKPLLSGGAVVKMAAVAAGAAVVGTNAVHSVVLRTFDRPHQAPVARVVQAATVRRIAPVHVRVAPPRPVEVTKTSAVGVKAGSHRPAAATGTQHAPTQPPPAPTVVGDPPAQPSAPAPQPSSAEPTTSSPGPTPRRAHTGAPHDHAAPASHDTRGSGHGHRNDRNVPATASVPSAADTQRATTSTTGDTTANAATSDSSAQSAVPSTSVESGQTADGSAQSSAGPDRGHEHKH